MEIYQSRVLQFREVYSKLSKKYNTISLFRLACAILCLFALFYYIKTSDAIFAIAAFLCFIGFIWLMRIHSRLTNERQLYAALLKINENEIAYLNRTAVPFENGIECNDFQHPYAYDLDIFGEHSLFQNVNRTGTYIGKTTLAKQLLTIETQNEIIENQQAVAELKSKLDWRHEFLALGYNNPDSREAYDALLRWKSASTVLPKMVVGLSFAVPALFLCCLIAYFVTSNAGLLSYLGYIFVANMIILGMNMKRIQAEIAKAENIDKIVRQYSLLVEKIGNETFESRKLIGLQQQLSYNNKKASSHLKQLSELFSRMDSIANLVTATLFNGTFLFNIHVLKALLQWKKENASELENWIAIIGKFEALNSLANLAYNNADFVFPKINSDYKIGFKNLSHPLLNPATRVGNDTSFYPESFIILTGSNMSGKSTFLRSLGVNMVLGGIGSVVCASEADIHPLPVLVSMRLSDSLSDSESYFFAEIKRLKQIMDALEEQPAFVLLDEILRGTNSDDKRNGTIEVVKKIISKKAVGAIATHDIEVCLTTNEYPQTLKNQCFEVEIKDNELHFDYQLRNGICQNKSATFLMKKMGVI
jgi:DNA mismatch repair ATPase MutS